MRKLLSILLAIILFLMPASMAVWAATYVTYYPITIVDTGGTDRTFLPVISGVTGTALDDAGVISATGTNTNLTIGGTNQEYLMGTTHIPFVVDSLPAYGQVQALLYTGYAPAQTSFDIIVGDGGYITVSDDADLELVDDFTIEIEDAYIDTTAGSGKDLLNKDSAAHLYIDSSTSGTMTFGIIASTNINPNETNSGNLGIYDQDAVYLTAQQNTTADGALADIYCGQHTAAQFVVYRGVCRFDTSALPDDCTITSATLNLDGNTDNSTDDFVMQLQQGSAGHPADPLAVGDFDKSFYSGNGGTWNSAAYVAGDNAITISATGLTWISKTGDTYFFLRSQEDINASQPANPEYCIFNSAGSDLVVNYDYDAKSVSAVNVTTGQHDIDVTADGVNLEISVDGAVAGDYYDTVALAGTSVTGNANDYIIMDNSTETFFAYMDYLKITTAVGGSSLKAWYEPIGMLTGTVLPDRQGAAENGAITWGANNNITVIYGEPHSYSATYTELGVEGGYEVPESDMPTDWYGTASNITNLPLYPMFAGIATSSGIPAQTLYIFAIIILAMSGAIFAYLTTQSLLAVLIAIGLVLGLGTAMTVVPMWIFMVFLIFGIGISYLMKEYIFG